MTDEHEVTPHWWEIALGSGAICVGAALYLGYSSLGHALLFGFGYTGPLFTVYAQEDVLMSGTSILFEYVAPKVTIGSVLAVVLGWEMSPDRAAKVARVAAVIFAVLACVMTLLPVSSVTLIWAINNGAIVAQVLLCVAAFVTLEATRGRFLAEAPAWSRAVIVGSGWLFLLWLIPLFVALESQCYPQATVRSKEGVEATYALINHKDGLLVVGDRTDRKLLFISGDNVASTTVQACPSP